MTEKTTKRSFVAGATVLAAAGLVGKVIAAFYRVWLNDLIGPQGLGIYQVPSTYYAFLLVISTAGIPTAISKLVSELLARGDERGAQEVFAVARRVLLLTGAVTTLLMALLAQTLAGAAGEPAAAPGFVALAPSLAIVCMLSAYRGYFQGRQQMNPSAVSQVIEQVGRLVFGFGLAVWWAPKGAAWGAAGAVLGVTLSEAAALAMILGSYRGFRRHRSAMQGKLGKLNVKPIALRIFRIAVPVTLGASIMPLVSLTDTMTVINRLTQIGYVKAEATAMFGVFSGMVQSIINMPAVITLSLSISLVPAISEAITRKRRELARDAARIGTKLAAIIGFPCAAGLFLLADPVMALLSPSYTAAEHALSVELLSFMAFAIIFLSINQTTTGILQGFGKPLLPVVSLGIGALVKVAVNYVLIGIPAIHIRGAAIGSICCYAVAAVSNVVFVVRQSGMRYDPFDLLVRPALCALCMAAAVIAARRWLMPALGQTIGLFACVGIGVAVYGAALLLLRVAAKQELLWLPAGGKLVALLTRLHLLKEG